MNCGKCYEEKIKDSRREYKMRHSLKKWHLNGDLRDGEISLTNSEKSLPGEKLYV